MLRRKPLFGKLVTPAALGSSDFGGKVPEALADELMDAYRSIGGNLLDTARVYGDFATPRNGVAEQVIGRYLSQHHCREEIFLSTKGAHPPMNDMRRGRLSREEICGDLSDSLNDLQTDCVDIFWLHRDDVARPVGEIMESLQSLIDAGMTRTVGASNWTTARIEEANAYADAHGLTPFAANQPRFSLARQCNVEDSTLVAMDAEMYAMHRCTKLVCVPFSSQAKGFFAKLDALGADNLPEKARRRYLADENLQIFARMKQVQRETGMTIAAMSVAWLTAQPFDVFPLLGASNVAQVLEMEASGNAILTEAQRDFIQKPLDMMHNT